MSKIYTVGHSSLTLETFVERLRAHDIETLVDIRSFPGSRKFPHFNKESLTISLPKLGIEYVHLPQLGGYRKASKSSPYINDGWKNASFRNYADYTFEESYEKGIESLLKIAQHKKISYCCSEAVCWRCHRLLVSNTLVNRGHEIVHIVDEKKLDVHTVGKYGAKPKVVEGLLVYPKDENEIEKPKKQFDWFLE